ncbi:MAG: hypothetical protein IIC08_04435 [Proteobacteria bacterium]|nr:hypothetical protein [Pseudomonadota bacterium]
MDEDRFNMSLRKFLKKVGITAQREIESNIRNAMAAGKLAGEGRVTARAVITLEGFDGATEVTGEIEIG